MRDPREDRYVPVDLLFDEEGELRPLPVIRREIIMLVIRENNGDVAKSARALGIGRNTVYRAIQELGLSNSVVKKLRKTPAPGKSSKSE
jgi:transcriptional regulator of acetoin/glycerol metabolism